MASPSVRQLEKSIASIRAGAARDVAEHSSSARVWGNVIRAYKLFREIAERYTNVFDDGEAIVIDLMTPITINSHDHGIDVRKAAARVTSQSFQILTIRSWGGTDVGPGVDEQGPLLDQPSASPRQPGGRKPPGRTSRYNPGHQIVAELLGSPKG